MTLDEALTRAGMTAYQLAKKSGVSQSQLSRIRDGKTSIEKVNLKTAIAIADALGIEPKDLLNNKEEKTIMEKITCKFGNYYNSDTEQTMDYLECEVDGKMYRVETPELGDSEEDQMEVMDKLVDDLYQKTIMEAGIDRNRIAFPGE